MSIVMAVTFCAAASACTTSDSDASDSDGAIDDSATPLCTSTPPFGSGCSDEGYACRFTTCTPTCINAGSIQCYLGAACTAGRWVGLDGLPCENPPAKCPTTEPMLGTSCSAGTFGGLSSCSYSDACPDRPASSPGTETLACTDGKWTLTTASYTPPCPSSPPKASDPCLCGVHAYPTCVYLHACADGRDLTASCDATGTRTWILICGPVDAGGDATDADADAVDADSD